MPNSSGPSSKRSGIARPRVGFFHGLDDSVCRSRLSGLAWWGLELALIGLSGQNYSPPGRS